MGITAWKLLNREIQITDNSVVEITAQTALAQRLVGLLEIFPGEWSFDTELGVNWIDALGTKPFRSQDLEPKLREVLLSDNAVVSVLELTITPDNATRGLAIAFKVDSDVGRVEGGILIT